MNLLENFEVRQFNNLELLAKQVVEGFIVGLHRSPFHGFSVEFAEHRLYNQGESTRNIDWKVYARTDKMFVKRYEEETNLRCQIVIDTSSSMYLDEQSKTGGDPINKLEFSALAAASLMNLLRKQRDAFGLSLFDSSLYQSTKAKSSTIHYRLLLSYLEQAIADERPKKTSNIVSALHQVAESIHKRSLVIIFSDMFTQAESPDELFSAIQHLKYNKHEVILFQVVNAASEINFEYENRPYLFVDVETGEEVKVQPHKIKEYYLDRIKAYEKELKLKCMQYGVDFIEADINAGYKSILQSYLVKRKKMNV